MPVATVQIVDYLYSQSLDGSGNLVQSPIANAVVAASPATTPVFVLQADGNLHPVESPWPSGTTDGTGKFTVTLPQSSAGNTDPANLKWNLSFPDGTVWQGAAPNAAGPFTMEQLKTTWGWGVVVGGINGTTVQVQGPPGSGSTPSGAAGGDLGSTYPNPTVVAGNHITTEVTGTDFKPSGLTGATAASRYVGATASGAPASGTFSVGDFVVDQTGTIWICTAAGTPGTWQRAQPGDATTASTGVVQIDQAPYTGAHPVAVTLGPRPSGDTSGATDNAALQGILNGFPAAGGILRLWPGTYYITGLTTSAPTTIEGAGCADSLFNGAVTTINCPSATANAISVGARPFTARGFSLVNTAVATPTAGAGIVFSSAHSGDGARLIDLSVRGFYINVDVQRGGEGYMSRCFIYDPVLYGVKLANADNTDDGDWSFAQCNFYSGSNHTAPTSLLRLESGGGYRVTGCKFNNRTTGGAATALDAAVADGVGTGDLLVTGCSIENFASYGIRVHLSGVANTGTFVNVVITGNQIAQSVSGVGVSITPEASGKIQSCILGANSFDNVATGYSLANVDNVVLEESVYLTVTTPISIGASVTNVRRAAAMTRISQQILTGTAATITFSSIPGIYTDLLLVLTGRGDNASAGVDLQVQVNGDTGANYDHLQLEAQGSTVSASPNIGLTSAFPGALPAASATSGLAGTSEVTFPLYAGTTFQKEIHGIAGEKQAAVTSNLLVRMRRNWWRNTAAITSITAFPSAGNFVAGTTATLYGIT